jgi:hypothetical protein
MDTEKESAPALAEGFLADLRGNVDAWYADRIGCEAFHALQGATWEAICAAGSRVEELVLRTLRERLTPLKAARSAS